MVLIMSENPRRHFLKEKEAKQLLDEFSQRFNVDTERLLGSKPHIELVKAQVAETFIINGKPLLARFRGALLPTLIFYDLFTFLPKILVNMGAVPHICNGADVMAPGVVRIDGEFNKNDTILIVDERHGKPLAVGVALLDSQVMKTLKQGKVAKNIHYVGDGLWNCIKTLV
ncbi:MAG: H/ACA RNA-protein complex component Cbf5p [Candidatus Bathyarchaeota archaeon BA1]|nr:MAG: H/ACA RNA-protein complex component Cbf5p [Candidatus Bathyarchaeota archaeon BA1]